MGAKFLSSCTHVIYYTYNRSVVAAWIIFGENVRENVRENLTESNSPVMCKNAAGVAQRM